MGAHTAATCARVHAHVDALAAMTMCPSAGGVHVGVRVYARADRCETMLAEIRQLDDSKPVRQKLKK